MAPKRSTGHVSLSPCTIYIEGFCRSIFTLFFASRQQLNINTRQLELQLPSTLLQGFVERIPYSVGIIADGVCTGQSDFTTTYYVVLLLYGVVRSISCVIVVLSLFYFFFFCY